MKEEKISMLTRKLKLKSLYYRVYSNQLILVNDGANVRNNISISANGDFILQHIRIFVPDYSLNFRVEFRDGTTNENWLNEQAHVTAFTNQSGIIPFYRYLPRKTDVTITMYNNSGAAANMQVNFVGYEVFKIANEV